MSVRSFVSSVLALVLVASSAPGFAEEPSNRDVELLDALIYLTEHDGAWSKREWQDFLIQTGKYVLIGTAVVGTGTALYYFKYPKGFVKKSLLPDSTVIVRAEKFIASHGKKVVYAVGTVATPIVIGHVVTQLATLNSLSEAERLRNASTPDARVYRSHLRQFYKLTLSEQFMIAHQDESFTDHLIKLAAWIRAGRPSHTKRPDVRVPATPTS